MNRKIIINHRFENLRDFILKLPDIFETEGRCIYKARNEIKTFDVNGICINVKSYKVPILINRIVYAFFRPTKARRAYEHALKVLEKGFQTPEPIAYIEEYHYGFFTHSFFISLQSDLSENMRVFNDADTSNAGKENLIKAFASYTANLHNNGILHIDYSPGNILYKKDGDNYEFSLVDINRMKFCSVNMIEGCRNFRRICGNDYFFKLLAKEYAKFRHFDEEACINKVLYFKTQDRKNRNRKKAREMFFKK